MSFKQFISELNGSRVEGELIKTAIYSLLTSIVFLIIIYFVRLRAIENFFPKYGLPLFFLVISYALIAATIRQVRAYHAFACMSGMMIGMTTGMIGFIPGFYIASTNGMFIGGFFGVAIGMFLGIWSGKCCGVMGVMEGMMAGFMGGLMGAMTAFMLINDHLQLASLLVFLISTAILIGLNYMVYLETKESKRERHESHITTIVLTIVLIAISTYLMILGPRSAIFS